MLFAMGGVHRLRAVAAAIPDVQGLSLWQQMAEVTGVLDFLLHWRSQAEALIEAAENDDVDALMVVESEVSAWNRAVAAFADWRASA